MSDVKSQGWTTYLTRSETKDGREIQMPEWVMEHLCNYVDSSRGAAIVEDGHGGWLVTNCYDVYHVRSGPHEDIEDARRVCDEFNRDAGLGPLVIPAHWAVIVMEEEE